MGEEIASPLGMGAWTRFGLVSSPTRSRTWIGILGCPCSKNDPTSPPSPILTSADNPLSNILLSLFPIEAAASSNALPSCILGSASCYPEFVVLHFGGSTYAPCPPPPKSPKPSPKRPATCPKDTLKLGVCADLLNGLVHVVVGSSSRSKCCPLISGLADLDAAVCLCTAIKANVLGINLNVPLSLSLLLNTCGKTLPAGYKCY